MNKSPKRKSAWLRPLTVIATVSALVLVSGSAALANHAWGNYHWERSSNAVEVKIASNLDAKYDPYMDEALGPIGDDDWRDSSVLSLKEVSGSRLKNCGAVGGQVEVCNDSYGFRRGGWLGVATIWADGDHITKATVQLNDTFLFGGGTYSTDAWRQMVTCQEIGHVFGLDHQDEDFYNANLGTCMDYTNDPTRIDKNGQDNRRPNQHDYDELADIYAHDHTGSGGGGDGGGGDCNPRSPKCNNGALKAPPFSQASRANGSVYVDRLPNGLTRIKHVFWVPRR